MSKLALLGIAGSAVVAPAISSALSLDKNTYIAPKEPKKVKGVSKHQLHKAKQCASECVYCKLNKGDKNA